MAVYGIVVGWHSRQEYYKLSFNDGLDCFNPGILGLALDSKQGEWKQVVC